MRSRVKLIAYLVATKSSIGRTSVIVARKDFDVVIATVLFILHFKAEKTEVHILACRRFNDPITVLFVIIICISIPGIGLM